MLLRWIYYGVALVLASPFITWNAIVSVIMWDGKYWDNACYGIYQALTDRRKDFLNTNSGL